jgi:hypothetical protein
MNQALLPERFILEAHDLESLVMARLAHRNPSGEEHSFILTSRPVFSHQSFPISQSPVGWPGGITPLDGLSEARCIEGVSIQSTF